MNILLVGRGPSAPQTVDAEAYDLVIKLKQCRSGRCDVVVFAADELISYPENEYDIFPDPPVSLREIWYFDMFDMGFRTTERMHQRLSHLKFHKICNEAIDDAGSMYGFRLREYPRFTTGMATIVETLRQYPNATVSLVGFDNLVHDTNIGEFDHPNRKTNTKIHNTHLEHLFMLHLKKQGYKIISL